MEADSDEPQVSPIGQGGLRGPHFARPVALNDASPALTALAQAVDHDLVTSNHAPAKEHAYRDSARPEQPAQEGARTVRPTTGRNAPEGGQPAPRHGLSQGAALETLARYG